MGVLIGAIGAVDAFCAIKSSEGFRLLGSIAAYYTNATRLLCPLNNAISLESIMTLEAGFGIGLGFGVGVGWLVLESTVPLPAVACLVPGLPVREDLLWVVP